MKTKFTILLFSLFAACSLRTAFAQNPILITATGVAGKYSQDFNTLPNSGTNPSATFISSDDFYGVPGLRGFVQNGMPSISGSPKSYYDDGNLDGAVLTNRFVMSYGASGDNDRAIGAVTYRTRFGFRFKNNTGKVITKLTIQYTGEQWRQGATLLNPGLTFFYVPTKFFLPPLQSFNNLTENVKVPELNFSAIRTGIVATPLNGNDIANQKVILASFPINLANGDEILLGWEGNGTFNGSPPPVIVPFDDFHGLAIDNFSLVAEAQSFPTFISANNFPPTLAEGGGVYTVNVNLVNPSATSSTTIDIVPSLSSANPDVSGLDYNYTPSTLTFAPNQSQASFFINILPHTNYYGVGTFKLEIANLRDNPNAIYPNGIFDGSNPGVPSSIIPGIGAQIYTYSDNKLKTEVIASFKSALNLSLVGSDLQITEGTGNIFVKLKIKNPSLTVPTLVQFDGGNFISKPFPDANFYGAANADYGMLFDTLSVYPASPSIIFPAGLYPAGFDGDTLIEVKIKDDLMPELTENALIGVNVSGGTSVLGRQPELTELKFKIVDNDFRTSVSINTTINFTNPIVDEAVGNYVLNIDYDNSFVPQAAILGIGFDDLATQALVAPPSTLAIVNGADISFTDQFFNIPANSKGVISVTIPILDNVIFDQPVRKGVVSLKSLTGGKNPLVGIESGATFFDPNPVNSNKSLELTITEDDNRTNVNFSSIGSTSIETISGPFIIPIVLTNPSPTDTTFVTISDAGGDAVAGVNYTINKFVIKYPPGSTTPLEDIAITLINNLMPINISKRIRILIAGVTGGQGNPTFSNNPFEFTIKGGAPISMTQVKILKMGIVRSVFENVGVLTFNIGILNPSKTVPTFGQIAASSNGSAIEGINYSFPTTSFSFPATGIDPTPALDDIEGVITMAINILADGIPARPTLTLITLIKSVSGGDFASIKDTTLNIFSFTTRIRDADLQTSIRIVTKSIAVNESSGFATFTFSITNPSAINPTTVNLNLATASASDAALNTSDFTLNPTPYTIVFPANSGANQVVNIPIVNDNSVEIQEFAVFQLENIGGGLNATTTILGGNQIELTINDDDKSPVLSFDSEVSGAFEGTIAVRKIKIFNPSTTFPTVVDVSVTGFGGAVSGVNYNPIATLTGGSLVNINALFTVTFPAGSAITQDISIKLLQDGVFNSGYQIESRLLNPRGGSSASLDPLGSFNSFRIFNNDLDLRTSGDGTATVVNGSSSTLQGTQIWTSNSANQTVDINIRTGNQFTGNGSSAINNVDIEIPSGWNASSANVQFIGRGYGSATYNLIGNSLSIQNTSLVGQFFESQGTIRISGLTTPIPASNSTGQYIFGIKTSTNGFAPASIAGIFNGYVTIPIAQANQFGQGKTLAVSGTVQSLPDDVTGNTITLAMQDNDTPFSGMFVQAIDNVSGTVVNRNLPRYAIGDSIIAFGTLIITDNVLKGISRNTFFVGKSLNYYAPIIKTFAELTGATSGTPTAVKDQYSGMLMRVKNVTPTAPIGPLWNGGNGFLVKDPSVTQGILQFTGNGISLTALPSNWNTNSPNPVELIGVWQGAIVGSNVWSNMNIQPRNRNDFFANKFTWDGGAGTSNWNDALNWSPDFLPTANDTVVLDNSNLPFFSYKVVLPNTPVLVNSIKIEANSGLTIAFELPNSNTASSALSLNSSSIALEIGKGCTFKNSSGITSSVTEAIAFTGGGKIKIGNLGRYIHNTLSASAGIVNRYVLSALANKGIFEFDVPTNASYDIVTSGISYGSLKLSSVAAGGAKVYSTTMTAPTTISGYLFTDANATFAPSGAGNMTLKGNIYNFGNWIPTASQSINFNRTDSAMVVVGNSIVFRNNVVANVPDRIELNIPITVAGGTFSLTSGKVYLNNGGLRMTNSGNIIGGNASNYFVTNGKDFTKGYVTQNNVGSTALLYPIGSITSYTPLTIQNAGIIDNFKARTLDSLFANASNAGGQTFSGVNRTWLLEEEVAGGSALNLTTQWNTADELPSFDRSNSEITYRVTSSVWQQTALGSASGSNPYTRSLNNFTSLAGLTAFGVVNSTSGLFLERADFKINTLSTCSGITLTFTDLSTGANSFAWNFGAGATPATANTAGPHNVVYTTTGTKIASLDINGGGGTKTKTITNITILQSASIANAGISQSICGTSTTLAATTPTNGTGAWSLVSGGGILVSPFTTTSITALNIPLQSSSVFKWTVSNPQCQPGSTSVVTVTNVSPSVANAGLNQTVCGSAAILSANVLTFGSGLWQVVSGAGAFTSASLPNTSLTALALGANVLRWSTFTPLCTTTSLVTITSNFATTPTVSLLSSLNSTVCAGTVISFTSTGTNVGASPVYSWFRNGAFQNNGTNYSNALANNDQIQAIVSVTGGCFFTNTASTAIYTATVNPNLTPSIAVASNTNTAVCSGTGISFTATGSNIAGGLASYGWYKNNIFQSVSNTYASSVLANNDQITSILSLTGGCFTSTTSSSVAYTATVNPNLTTSVILTSNANSAVCSGTGISFTATGVNTGTSPMYVWSLNGTPVQTGATYSNSNLANSDNIQAFITASGGCFANNTASSAIYVSTVSSPILPSVLLLSSTNTSVCSGTGISFTATGTNLGTTPAYGWYNNGDLVSTGSMFNSNSLANGNQIQAIVTAKGGCFSTPSASSAIFVASINPVFTPNIIVSSTNTTVCSSVLIGFTATGSNAGATPTYAWYNNGAFIGASSVFSSTSLFNNDIITAALTVSSGCFSSNTATSNAVTINILPSVSPTVLIPTTLPAVCAGGSVTVTSAIANAGIITPVYTWFKNGTATGIATNTYIYVPVNGDQVSVKVATDGQCTALTTITSNSLVLNTTLPLTPTVSIIATGGTTLCGGNTSSFTSTIANGGATPVYTWYVNEVAQANTLSTFNFIPSGSDNVKLQLTTSELCVTTITAASNVVNLTVTLSLIPQIVLTSSATILCEGAVVTITSAISNAGSAPTYLWVKNGLSIANGIDRYIFTPTNQDKVVLRITGGVGCINSAQSNDVNLVVNAIVTPTSTLNYTSNTICGGNTVLVSSSITGGGLAPAYSWKINGVNAATSTTLQFVPINNQTVSLELTSSEKCLTVSNPIITSAGIIFTVLESFTPTVSIAVSDTLICTSSIVTVTGSITNGGSSPALVWLENGTVNNNGNGNLILVSPSKTASYQLRLITTAACATASEVLSNMVTIVVNEVSGGEIDLSASTQTVCIGSMATIVLKNASGTITWQSKLPAEPETAWTNTTDVNDSLGVYRIKNAVTPRQYRSSASSPICGQPLYSSNSIAVSVDQLTKSGTATASTEELCNDGKFSLKLTNYLGNNIKWQVSRDSVTFEEFNSSINDADMLLAELDIRQYESKYYYRAQVKSGVCPNVATNIVVISVCGSNNFIPNGFTPNGDKTNAYWDLSSIRLLDQASIKVFDRYGGQVFESTGKNFKDTPWDGDNLPAATYWYIIDRKDGSKILRSSVTIFK